MTHSPSIGYDQGKPRSLGRLIALIAGLAVAVLLAVGLRAMVTTLSSSIASAPATPVKPALSPAPTFEPVVTPAPIPAPAPAAPATAPVLAAATLPATPSEFNQKAATPPSGDYTMWAGRPHRNMISGEKNPPVEWNVEEKKNIKWTLELGSKSYGNPVIADGRLFLGTNNASKKDPKHAEDGGVEMCIDEKTGAFLWQKYYSKLAAGRVNDWPGEGLCATVYTEKDRVWYCNNRCEVVCLDLSAGAKKTEDGSPPEVWKVDMMAKFGVFPHNMTSAAIASWGDLIYVITGNGVDDTHKNVVAPKAPAIIAFNKKTGDKVWSDNSPGANVLHGQWSSVAITEMNGRPLVIAPLGDAWVYAFDARDGKIVWKFDANPKDSLYIPGGDGGRNEIIATPVIVGNKMYLATGQDPEHGTGRALMWCVRIDKEGDISAELPGDAPKPKPGDVVGATPDLPSRKGKPNPNTGVVWCFDKDANTEGEKGRMHRSISTAAVHNGLVYIPDFNGYIHCLDAETGKQHWAFDTEAEIWGSAMVCDGKVYLGNGDGDIFIFAEGKEFKQIAKHNMGASVFSTPVMANGTLYVMSMNKLFAIQEKK